MKEKINDKNTIFIEPTHPSIEGLVGFLLELENGKISKAAPKLGYSRRNIEKAAINKDFQEYLPFAEKISTNDTLFYAQAYISVIEQLLEIEPTLYAQYIRVLTMELSRIYTHIDTFRRILELKGTNSLCFEVKKIKYEIIDILRKITNTQNLHGSYVLGGVKNDITSEILDKIRDFSTNFAKNFKNIEYTIEKNPVFAGATKGLGFLDTQNALEYSITGVNLRAAGLNLDFRKEKPYLIYDKLEFSISTAFEGDCHSRFVLRIDEIKTSLSLINQCIDWILANRKPENELNFTISDVQTENKTAVSYTESPKGLIMCRAVLGENRKLKSVKWRTPSFYTVQALEKVLIDCSLGDFATIFNSLDIDSMEAER